MHYKNGRPASVGDIVIGPTHNSEQKLRIGEVIELMPKQGPCNVRLSIIGRTTGIMVGAHNDIEANRFFGGRVLTGPLRGDKLPTSIEVAEDFADSKKLMTVVDAYRALDAIHSYALHDSPYFPVPPLDF